MKKAKVTVAFAGRPDHETAVRTIAVGEIIEGDLAVVALREKWAVDPDKKPAPSAKPKALKEMSTDELKAFEAEKQIVLGDAATASDMIAAIELATEAKA